MSAGLERENTILVVSKNADDWNKTLWEHVCQIMGEGTAKPTHNHRVNVLGRVGLTLINVLCIQVISALAIKLHVASWH